MLDVSQLFARAELLRATARKAKTEDTAALLARKADELTAQAQHLEHAANKPRRGDEVLGPAKPPARTT